MFYRGDKVRIKEVPVPALKEFLRGKTGIFLGWAAEGLYMINVDRQIYLIREDEMEKIGE